MSAQFEENADGSVIVTLDEPVRVSIAGVMDDVHRLTIPALTGRHIRLVPWGLGQTEVTMGQLATWAALVVTPAGAFDELDAQDARDVANWCGRMLGKSRRTGVGSSAT